MTTTTITQHVAALGITGQIKIVRVRGDLVHEEGPYGARRYVRADKILPVGATVEIPGQGTAVVGSKHPAYRTIGRLTTDIRGAIEALTAAGATITI